MIFWLNAQLPPSLAKWLTEKFGVRTVTRQYIAILNHLHNSCRGNPPPTPRGCPIPRRAGTLGTAPTYLHE